MLFTLMDRMWGRPLGGTTGTFPLRRLERSGLRPRLLGHVILWSSGSPVQSGIPLAESHQPSCRSLIAKGTDSSSIAGRVGHVLQVAPIESAATRVFFHCARIPLWRLIRPGSPNADLEGLEQQAGESRLT